VWQGPRHRADISSATGPVTNVVAGWAGLVIAALLLSWAHVGQHPAWAFRAAAVGVLLLGLFHAGPGAFGRPDAPRQGRADSNRGIG
jgi:hypothetical protein